jgi:hypothetical protein
VSQPGAAVLLARLIFSLTKSRAVDKLLQSLDVCRCNILSVGQAEVVHHLLMPSTLVLLGSALVGVALLASKRALA